MAQEEDSARGYESLSSASSHRSVRTARSTTSVAEDVADLVEDLFSALEGEAATQRENNQGQMPLTSSADPAEQKPLVAQCLQVQWRARSGLQRMCWRERRRSPKCPRQSRIVQAEGWS